MAGLGQIGFSKTAEIYPASSAQPVSERQVRPVGDLLAAAQVRPLTGDKLRHAGRRWNQGYALI